MITQGALQGHWVRDWIKAPGFEDHTSRVHWMQAGFDYADVRIPMARPDLRDATCLAELPAPALVQLGLADGFAGHITLEGSRCTWHREINWHGTPDTADIGEISFDCEGRMIEAGVLADYTELWSQKAKATTKSLRFSDGVYEGILITSGAIGVLAIGQPAKASTKLFWDALKTGSMPEEVESHFDGFHALCRVEGERIVADLALNPFVEGRAALSFLDDRVVWHKQDFTGATSDLEMMIHPQPK